MPRNVGHLQQMFHTHTHTHTHTPEGRRGRCVGQHQPRRQTSDSLGCEQLRAMPSNPLLVRPQHLRTLHTTCAFHRFQEEQGNAHTHIAPPPPPPNRHTHARTHTRTPQHPHIHTLSLTHSHTRIHTHARARAQTHRYRHTHTVSHILPLAYAIPKCMSRTDLPGQLNLLPF